MIALAEAQSPQRFFQAIQFTIDITGDIYDSHFDLRSL